MLREEPQSLISVDTANSCLRIRSSSRWRSASQGCTAICSRTALLIARSCADPVGRLSGSLRRTAIRIYRKRLKRKARKRLHLKRGNGGMICSYSRNERTPPAPPKRDGWGPSSKQHNPPPCLAPIDTFGKKSLFSQVAASRNRESCMRLDPLGPPFGRVAAAGRISAADPKR